ncbi:helix-turn-helix transcriptional regulator [Treponema primitia]|uniref:helix-turn-helix domain-containing protein n=1 Tax=Treponema primitia TaxID=88058 RepID=UPI0039808B6B
MTKNTEKKARINEEKPQTKATQGDIADFSTQISKLVGQTSSSIEQILGEATHKIKDLAGDETLKPIFKELGEYLKREFKPQPSVFDLFGKVPKQNLPDVAKHIGQQDFNETTNLMSAFVKENRSWESFGFALERLREERGYKPAELYHRAQIDKRLYSKILGSSNYRPKKETAVAFGLALSLSHDEFDEFLKTAGYALSYSSIADLVIRFCVEHKIYDLTDVNALLLEAGQKTLSRE